MNLFLRFRVINEVINEENDVDLPAGSIVVALKEVSGCVTLLTSDNRIVQIRALEDEVLTNDPAKIDPTRKLIIWKAARGWYQNGNNHRDDGPAFEYESGTKEWLKNGQFHRDDGPAIEWASGTKHWYKHGLRHRNNGPAIEGVDGTKEWWENDKLLFTVKSYNGKNMTYDEGDARC